MKNRAHYGRWEHVIFPKQLDNFPKPGAYKEGKFWMIPSDAQRPAVLREKKQEMTRARKPTTKLLPCAINLPIFGKGRIHS